MLQGRIGHIAADAEASFENIDKLNGLAFSI